MSKVYVYLTLLILGGKGEGEREWTIFLLKVKQHPGDPKLSMTSQFNQKGKGRKENQVVFFKKATFLKSELHLFRSIFPSRASDAAQFGC